MHKRTEASAKKQGQKRVISVRGRTTASPEKQGRKRVISVRGRTAASAEKRVISVRGRTAASDEKEGRKRVKSVGRRFTGDGTDTSSFELMEDASSDGDDTSSFELMGNTSSDGDDTSSFEFMGNSSSDGDDTSSFEFMGNSSSAGDDTSSFEFMGNASSDGDDTSSFELKGISTSDEDDSSSYKSEFHDSEADNEFEVDSVSMFLAEPDAELVETDASTRSKIIKKNLSELKEFKMQKIPDDVLHCRELDGELVKSKIIEVFREVGASVLKEGVHYFKIPWSKTVFDSTLGYYVKKKARRSGFATMLSRKSSRYACLLSQILVLIEKEGIALAKEVTHWDQTLYETTENVKAVVDAICMSFGCVRSSLRIISGSKGSVVGPLKYRVKDTWVDCDSPQPIPREDAIPKDFKSEADFIIIVEKDTVFLRLCNSDFCGRYGGIMVTAEGQPNVNVRMFVQSLRQKLKIPVFAFVDCNPSGFSIMSAYKHGMKTRAFENHRMAVPDLKWIGLHPTDAEKYNMSNNGVALTVRDIENCESLLKKQCVNDVPDFKPQLELMLSTNRKYKIESLGTSLTRYLLEKLETRNWI